MRNKDAAGAPGPISRPQWPRTYLAQHWKSWDVLSKALGRNLKKPAKSQELPVSKPKAQAGTTSHRVEKLHNLCWDHRPHGDAHYGLQGHTGHSWTDTRYRPALGGELAKEPHATASCHPGGRHCPHKGTQKLQRRHPLPLVASVRKAPALSLSAREQRGADTDSEARRVTPESPAQARATHWAAFLMPPKGTCRSKNPPLPQATRCPYRRSTFQTG